MTIQLHRLEGFYWVSVHSGYAAAARGFPYPITQPAVHQQVKKLEDDLGCKLFERVAKDRVRHTPEGRRLYRFCAPFFEELPSVVRALKTGEYDGELRIDGTPLAVRRLLPEWIRKLSEEHPGIAVSLTEVPSSNLDRLRTGDADLIVDHFAAIPAGVEYARVGTAYSFLVVPDGHKAVTRKKMRLALLAGETFVALTPSSPQSALQMSDLEVASIVPGKVLSAPSTEAALSYVAAGLGFTLLRWLDKQGPEHPGASVRRLKDQISDSPVHAAYRPGPGANPIVRAALACAPQSKKRR